MKGYSDRINHALAFAAKHHDQRVRRGTRPPYSTHSANLAVILTRYDSDEDTVIAGIVLEAVRDYAREPFPAEVLRHRIGEKFGGHALEIALMATERRLSDEGIEFSADERRAELLARLGAASTEGQLLAAADALHGAGTLLADLRRTVDVQSVWGRVAGGRQAALQGYQRLHDRLREAGFQSPILDELRETISALGAA